MGAKDLYKLFIDSGAFIALIDERDPMHQASQTFYTSLEMRSKLITSLTVVSETYIWLRYHVSYDSATRFLGIIERSEKAGDLKVILPDDDMKSKTHAILKNYPDQDLSYTDAISFVILENMNIDDVFSFDSHFYIIKRTLWPIVKKA
jgi:hypothetical protein